MMGRALTNETFGYLASIGNHRTKRSECQTIRYGHKLTALVSVLFDPVFPDTIPKAELVNRFVDSLQNNSIPTKETGDILIVNSPGVHPYCDR